MDLKSFAVAIHSVWNALSPKNGLRPHLLQMFAQISPFQWALHNFFIESCIAHSQHKHFYFPFLFFFSTALVANRHNMHTFTISLSSFSCYLLKLNSVRTGTVLFYWLLSPVPKIVLGNYWTFSKYMLNWSEFHNNCMSFYTFCSFWASLPFSFELYGILSQTSPSL